MFRKANQCAVPIHIHRIPAPIYILFLQNYTSLKADDDH